MSEEAHLRMKLAYTIDEVTAITGLGRTSIYEFLKSGRLKARKAGKRTLVLAADLAAFIDALPPARAA